MANQFFKEVTGPRIKRSVFDLSHDVNLTCRMGKLIPTMKLYCVPGDKWQGSQHGLVRFLPLIAPVMSRFNVSFHNWFVAHRLLWDHWDEYIAQTKVSGFIPAHPFIEIRAEEWVAYPLMDYLGIPDPISLGATPTEVMRFNAFPFAAYQMTWNENYRDQNLQPEVNYKLVDGNNTFNADLFILRESAWNHDYFTSCLPTPQKGDPVLLPVVISDAEVKYQDNILGPAGPATVLTGAPIFVNTEAGTSDNPTVGNFQLYADNATTTSQTDLNEFRMAVALQKLKERLMRGGSRIIEVMKNVFGVKSKDARYQRPEYISGSVTPVVISEVLNTSDTTTAPQGNMAGHGFAVPDGKTGHFFCQEFGYIITLMCIKPVAVYSTAMDRDWFIINSPNEQFYPDYTNLGEEAVKQQEILPWGGAASDGQDFGYLPRYSFMRFMHDRVCGQFRTTLSFWASTRFFTHASPPALNADFIQCEPTDDIFAVQDPDLDNLVVKISVQQKMIRPLPYFGTPGLTV